MPVRRACLLVTALLFSLASVRAAGVAISGKLTLLDGRPAADSRVLLVELDRSTFADEKGAFRFDGVPPGRYHVQVTHRRFGESVREVDVADADVTLDLTIERSAHHESIVVTAGAGRGGAEVYRPATVVDEGELAERREATLGETLAGLPGVRSSYYGPGSSRPVIRGLEGGRVRVLEGGLDVGDASSTSPDHAVASDPAAAQRIEILRGPATLLYGGSAVGGVVNVIDGRVPDHLPQDGFAGAIDLRTSSVANERAGSFDASGGLGRFAWQAGAFTRDTDDYEIPGPAVLGDPDSPSERLPNSALSADGGSIGASWIGAGGHVGLAVKRFETTYGIPAALGEAVTIDLDHDRYDLRGRFRVGLGPFDTIAFGAGLTDYAHREIEEGALATTFLNDGLDTRVELQHGGAGTLRGVAGIQVNRRDFEAVGDEAFLPPSETDNLAAFVLEEIDLGELSVELGGRYERQDNAATGGPDRDFDGLSASVAGVRRFGEAWSLGLSLSRAERFPSAEELYADGPHLATGAFERGDVDLENETSNGVDLTLRRHAGRIAGELSLFVNEFDAYIFDVPTGEIEDELPVFQFTQADARFVGAELSARFDLVEAEHGHLGLELSGDAVRAERHDTGEDLPRIPPYRVGLTLHWRGERLTGSLEGSWYDDQDRVTPFETPTEGYTMVGASAGYRIPHRGLVHELLLRASNLTDEEARNHVSRLKDSVPLPGRDVGFVYRLLF